MVSPDLVRILKQDGRAIRTIARVSKPTQERDDREELALVERIRSGDHDAWSELLGPYQDRLFAVCVRMVGDRELAADLAQESMVRVIQRLDTFRGGSKLSTWIIRVTMNVCLSKLRSEKLRRHASLTPTSRAGEDNVRDSWTPEAREPGGVSRVELDEQRQRLSEALLGISADQRAILILRDNRGLDYEQIAEVLGVAVGTVKSRLFRARNALRNAMEEL